MIMVTAPHRALSGFPALTIYECQVRIIYDGLNCIIFCDSSCHPSDMSGIAFGVLAIPEIILSFAKIGKFIFDRIQAFNNAPQYLQELKLFGYDIYSGQLQASFQVVSYLIRETSDSTLRSISERHVTRLESLLDKAQTILDKAIDRTGNVNRL